MIALSSTARVYLACGVTDMRKGMVGLVMMVQQKVLAGGIPVSVQGDLCLFVGAGPG